MWPLSGLLSPHWLGLFDRIDENSEDQVSIRMLLAVSFENELLSLIVLILTDHARFLVLSTLVDVSRQIEAACAD